ncbi:MAG: histidinol-phosphatase [Treponema sp.]|nr:histidinol-phosphatase [Treponema sp.]
MSRCFSSLHTHTTFCDGKDDIEAMCKSAFEKELAAIGFSSHAPVGKAGFETSWHMKDGRLGEYIDEVKSARRRWEGRIAVYLGLEVDYIKGLRSPLDKDIQDLNLDYIIGSVHYVMPLREEPFTVDGSAEELEKGITEGYNGDGEAMMHDYWNAVLEMTALGGLDIIGHLDLVKKGNFRGNPVKCLFDMKSRVYIQRVEEAAQAIAAGGFAVEVNTGMMNRGYCTETCPSLPVLRLLRRYNVPVMISADAHCADHLDGNYGEARQILLNAGYTTHAMFAGRKDGKAVWRETPL